MPHFIHTEVAIRLTCFAVVFAVMAIWELLAPRRKLTIKRPWRWTSNLGLLLVNSLLLRLIAPLGAAGVALFAESRGWGLFNAMDVPAWMALVLTLLILDLTVYLQHVVFHAVPLLWRLHLVHHADLDIDVTTGSRFHTLEILLSFGIKSVVILLVGASAEAVVIFEVLLNGTAMFNHSNVRMPLVIDRWLRVLVVTPDMHRVHHSWHSRETNSNFGFNLPWWDHLFGTYRDQPSDGHESMTIGLKEIRDERIAERLPKMLALPFAQILSESVIDEEK